ncbi:hypothetical protein EMPS_02029 [Entomortierella parvispora]|uniref:Uncharacterized protein n=1 Tax=Entomortierella parvispora TaxID=205924 RepID=A0A9P3H3Z0_9FUNG|nr:hypothetical protein EMPS_02029 [Entomortierella parvispora]
MGCKKSRRFSLIRIFGSNNTPQPSPSSIENIPEHYCPSPPQPSHRHLRNDLHAKLLRERRNSIASMSDNRMFRSKSSFDVKASRPFLSRGSSQATTTPAPEMNEKMRQFDELLQTHCGGTIRISLTPSLLQEP